ncbi:MAG: hypothetical protein ACTSX8_10335 [Alphaproteobacteria bacterium]
MGLPCQHRVDAKSVYICSEDSAWDAPRILDEQRTMEEPQEHPVRRWLAGGSRFDLECLPTEYLRPEDEPTRFHIRRLSTATWGVLRDMAGSMTQKTNAAWRAFQEGVVNVDGLAADIVWPGADLRKTLTAEDMREIERVLPRPFILEVGAAVLVANADLTEDEKKTSDS